MATINSINSNIPIELAKGGTNASTMTNTNGINYFDGTRIVTTTVGTLGQVLTSNGAGVAPTFQDSPVPGTVLTYAPVVTFGGGSTGITYTTQSGYYYQLGKAVFFGIFIKLSNKGSSTGLMAVTLPAITPAASAVPTYFPVVQDRMTLLDSTGYYSVGGLINGTTIDLYQLGSNHVFGVGGNAIEDTSCINVSGFQVSGFYFTS